MKKANSKRSITEFPLDELLDDLVSFGKDLQNVLIARELGNKTLYDRPLDEVEESCNIMIGKIRAEIHRRVRNTVIIK